MTRCKHPPDHVVTKYDCDGLPDPLELSWRECLDCGAWLSLGPSNDEGEAVAAEIRAAEIAADLAAEGCWMSPFERWGFNDEWPTLRGGYPVKIETWSQRAGYLARAIHTHSEGTDED